MTTPKRQPRVLVVEDEFLVADMLQGILEDLGVEVVGPAYGLNDALALVEREQLDAAILDVNIRGASVGPVAEALTARVVPFALATGYHGDILDGFSSRAVLAKPYAASDIAAVLETLGVRANDG